MGWLSSLFHKEKKYEKTVKIAIHDYIVGLGNNLIFTQLPSEEYFINYIEFRIPELVLNNEDRVNCIFSNIEEGKQKLPFNVIINETGKKPIEIVDVTISDFGKCLINNVHIFFENVTLKAKVNNYSF